MSFVTTIRLQSGDRTALEREVDEIRSMAERKGAPLKGPHSHPPTDFSVPQYKDVHADERFSSWSYTVYERELELVGYEELARRIAEWDFSDSIHVEVEVDQQNPLGQGRARD